jgi:TPR repeat protein
VSDRAALNAGRQAIAKTNYAMAVTELLPLARKGNASAQYYLAWMSHQGRGLPENSSAALAWARRSAAQGNADAEFLIGLLYAQGKGVARDDVEAARWFQKAGAQGNWSGQMKTGMCHMCGLGLPLDYMKAYMWFELAASRSTGHDQMLNRNLRDVHAARNLTPVQIEEAQRLARGWKPQKPSRQKNPQPA